MGAGKRETFECILYHSMKQDASLVHHLVWHQAFKGSALQAWRL